MRALIIDDQPLVHEVMRTVLHRALNPSSIYDAFDLDAALTQGRRVRRLDIVLLDLVLPGCVDLEALTRFRAELPKPRVVILSALDSSGVIRDAIAAGAKGYIPKTSSLPLIQMAVSIVAAGGTYIPPEALRPARKNGADKMAALSALKLSGRQVEVLKCIAKGLPNRQIASELAISENTVKHHTHEVFKALGVSTRTEALVAAMRHGLHLD